MRPVAPRLAADLPLAAVGLLLVLLRGLLFLLGVAAIAP